MSGWDCHSITLVSTIIPAFQRPGQSTPPYSSRLTGSVPAMIDKRIRASDPLQLPLTTYT
jgi:hypothetical protein